MPQTQSDIQSALTYPAESNYRSDTVNRPTSNWPRLFRSLRWKYHRSVLLPLLEECGNFFLRIRVLLKTHKQALPGTVQRCLSEHGLLLACNDDMLRLQMQYPWIGLLGSRAACQAWAMGVEYALHNRIEGNSKEPIPS